MTEGDLPVKVDMNASLAAMARDLELGQSISKTMRVPVDGLGGQSPSKALSGLRNTLNQIGNRATDATGKVYRVESGSYMTHDGQAIILNAVLTCMDVEAVDDI